MRFIRGFDTSNLQRLMFNANFEPGGTYAEVSWGSKWGDPVWRIGLEFELPEAVHRWLDRRWERKNVKRRTAPSERS